MSDKKAMLICALLLQGTVLEKQSIAFFVVLVVTVSKEAFCRPVRADDAVQRCSGEKATVSFLAIEPKALIRIPAFK